MKSKEEIVQNWLPRYTGESLENFGKYILLTNFSNYVQLFADWNKVKVADITKPMQCVTAGDITLINFGMGSPTAATVMDLLAMAGGFTEFAARSRVVDTPTVTDRQWDRVDDAVLVPSRSNGYSGPVQEPRRAETEVVAGRQVHVIYRPSRGFEVRDN